MGGGGRRRLKLIKSIIKDCPTDFKIIVSYFSNFQNISEWLMELVHAESIIQKVKETDNDQEIQIVFLA